MSSGLRQVLACTACTLVIAIESSSAEAPKLEEQRLEPPSGPRAATLFTPIPSQSSGVVSVNSYNDPRMWGDRHLEYALGSIGTGIAIGDYDNDGLPDMFIVSKTGRSRLYRNLGAWRFADTTDSAGIARALSDRPGPGGDVPWSQGATFADVNDDGRLDLYLCRMFVPNLLFINRGDGTFTEESRQRGLDVDDASGMGAFCDFDRDGWLDVLVQTNMRDAKTRPEGQPDRLFRNRGDGFFEDVTSRSGISGPTLSHAAIWWDYNQDAWPDLYVASDFAPPDALYRNNGDGTFTNVAHTVLPQMPYSAMGADLGDVDNDGRIDFFVADMATTTHEKDQRGMASARAVSLAIEERADVAPQYLRNALYLNTGTSTFQEAAILAGLHATDWTWSVRFEDLDNDGRIDLQLTNGMVRELQNSDLRARVMRSESLGERMRLLRESPVLNERNLAFRNLGGLRFEDVSASWGLDHEGVSFGAAFGDLDGDGDLDLVYSNHDGPAALLRNDSDSGHRVVFALRGVESNHFGVGSRVEVETDAGIQVRELVLSRGFLSSSEPILHFGLGEDARIRRVTVAWPSGHRQEFTDLAADRRYVIHEPDTPVRPGPVGGPAAAARFAEVSEARHLALPAREVTRAEPNRQALMPTTFHRRGPALIASDLNGDGREDLLIGGSTRDPMRVALRPSEAFGQERPPRVVGLPTEPGLPDGPVLAFDADGDGDMDLFVTKTGAGMPATSPRLIPKLLLNDGSAGFSPAPEGTLPGIPISVGALAAADFDRDGRLDIFVGARVLPGKYPAAPRSALLAHRAGVYEDVTAALAPGVATVGMVTSALWTDVDNDGWPDLLLALEWGTIRYFRNLEGRGFEDQSEEAGFAAGGAGWWNSLAAADFNGDGRLDYAAGNQGLNSIYRASPERPVLVFAGAFAGTTAVQLVEAYYEGDRLYPRHTLKALSDAIAPVKRAFTSHDAYAKAQLHEILGAEKLAAADRWAATQFHSGVFLSQENGRFVFEPLPTEVQVSVAQGLVAGDFNGDGHSDICLVHNSYAPTQAIGRFGGGIGQLLDGDGRGGFRPVPPSASGFVIAGDAKALVTLDVDDDGAPDFASSRNNDSLLVFKNRTGSENRFLRVTLQGRVGNPTAIGARLSLRLTDGSVHVAEIAAGSGYWSQSTPACFFGYASQNPPQELEIRWPDGDTTRHPVPHGRTILTVSAP